MLFEDNFNGITGYRHRELSAECWTSTPSKINKMPVNERGTKKQIIFKHNMIRNAWSFKNVHQREFHGVFRFRCIRNVYPICSSSALHACLHTVEQECGSTGDWIQVRAVSRLTFSARQRSFCVLRAFDSTQKTQKNLFRCLIPSNGTIRMLQCAASYLLDEFRRQSGYTGCVSVNL